MMVSKSQCHEKYRKKKSSHSLDLKYNFVIRQQTCSDVQSGVMCLALETPQPHCMKTPDPCFNWSNVPADDEVNLNPGGG